MIVEKMEKSGNLGCGISEDISVKEPRFIF